MASTTNANAATNDDETGAKSEKIKLVSVNGAKPKPKTKPKAKAAKKEQGPRHCHVCGKQGHDKRNCPEAVRSKGAKVTSLAIVKVGAPSVGLMTVNEAARLAGVSDSNIYFWIKDKRITSQKKGYNRLVERKSLMRYLATYKGNPMAKVVQLHPEPAYRDDEHRAASEKKPDGSSRFTPPRETLSPNRRVELALRDCLDHLIDLDTEERRAVMRGLNTLINFTAAPLESPRVRIATGQPRAKQRCGHCGKLGHKKTACPKARRCSRCHSTSHDRRNCPDLESLP